MEGQIVFNKDAEAAGIYIMKVYDTDATDVWNHFTQPELLDQWWAPKPWRCETQRMDFREGGSWNYALLGADEKHFAGVNYHEINANRSFDWTDYFLDENANKIEGMPTVKWLFGFTGVEEGTKLTVNMHFNSENDMNKILEMGFEESFKRCLNQLEALLNNSDKI